MADPFEEILKGERWLRRPPDSRHEEICGRLHAGVAAVLSQVSEARLLPARSIVQTAPGTLLRPDLALVTASTTKLWLAAEIVNVQDHRFDTVIKKQIYEDLNLPRVWMIDPRYDNVEIYHASPYGLTLKGILAQREILVEPLLPGFALPVAQLFGLDGGPHRT